MKTMMVLMMLRVMLMAMMIMRVLTLMAMTIMLVFMLTTITIMLAPIQSNGDDDNASCADDNACA